jgi:dihydroxyacetone kinase-like predicted kinase
MSINNPFGAKVLSVAPLAVDVAVKNDRLHELAEFERREAFLIIDESSEYQVRRLEVGKFSSREPGWAFCTVAIELYTREKRDKLRNKINSIGPSSLVLKSTDGKTFTIL